MADNDTPLSDEERAELERLRAAQMRAAQEQQARQEREELARLRKSQKYAKEDAEYYAEKARRRAEREKERENPDYSVDDLPPMPLKQKIVIGVLIVVFAAVVAFLVWFNHGGNENYKTSSSEDGVAVASSATDGAASVGSAESDA